MTPPYSEATEAAVVGACIVWPDRVLEAVVASGLDREHFYVPRFAETWWAIGECRTAGQPVDPHTVAARVTDRRAVAEAIEEAGKSMPDHAPAWARIVIDHHRCRRLLPGLLAALRAAQAGQYVDAVVLTEAALDADKATAGGERHASAA